MKEDIDIVAAELAQRGIPGFHGHHGRPLPSCPQDGYFGGSSQDDYGARARSATGIPLHIIAWGVEGQLLNAPCVDCGRITGSWCNEKCLAANRMPNDHWSPGQATPFCTVCDARSPDRCHYCKGLAWCTPQRWQ